MISRAGLNSCVSRKSSYSSGEGGACVEVADGVTGVVPVGDSKAPEGPTFVFANRGWAGFVPAVKEGTFASR